MDAGIYLLGYAAEMWLKTAYCLIEPFVSPSLPVGSKFGPAKRQWENSYAPTHLPNQYKHSLIFWEAVIPLERAVQGKPALPASVSILLSDYVRLISDEWDVRMRYQPPQATESEATRVLHAVRWLKENQLSLWS